MLNDEVGRKSNESWMKVEQKSNKSWMKVELTSDKCRSQWPLTMVAGNTMADNCGDWPRCAWQLRRSATLHPTTIMTSDATNNDATNVSCRHDTINHPGALQWWRANETNFFLLLIGLTIFKSLQGFLHLLLCLYAQHTHTHKQRKRQRKRGSTMSH